MAGGLENSTDTMAAIRPLPGSTAFEGSRGVARAGTGFQKAATPIFLIAVTSLYYVLNAQILLGHYDLGWHLAAGDLIRSQGHIPLHDPWSFTAGSKQWFNLSWLWDVLASLLFQYTGFGGLIILTAACGGAIAGCLAAILLRSGASATTACITVLSACLLYPAFAAFPNIYLAASPNMATMLFAVIFYGACLRPTRRLFLLPALMLLWANLHGGFLLGLFVLGIFGGMAVLKRNWAAAKLYVPTGIACFAAIFVNPLGWHIFEGTTATLGNFVQAYITEWWPYYRNITLPGSIPGILYILIFAVLELRQGGGGPVEARLLSWLFLAMGLYQFRYLSFFFLFSTVPLAFHLDRLLPKAAHPSRFENLLGFAGIAMVCALPLAFMRMIPAAGLPPMLSVRDVGYLEAHFPHARLLNHWNYGGLWIFYDRGRIPVFVDGRASTAYPDGVLKDYFKLGQEDVNQADWDMVLAKYRIDTVMWMNTHDAVRRFLVGKRGWREAYRGAYASIYVRQ
jgi:hypothetical protein